jgi:hypothetical protein
MNAKDFIDIIRIVVVESSVKSMENNLESPPGRQPDKRLIDMSRWFNGLNDSEKKMVVGLIKESVEISVFGFLCLLDGVTAIEETETKGKLELFYEKGFNRVLLNDPNQEYLHNLFR